MDPVRAKLISWGKDGKTAEVVSYIGEKTERRSITSHIKLVGHKIGNGLNPDKAAVAKLVAAEKVETATVEIFNEYNTKFSAVKAALGSLKETKVLAKQNGIVLDPEQMAGIEKRVRVDLKSLSLYVVGLGHAMVKANENASALRKTTPTEVEFVF